MLKIGLFVVVFGSFGVFWVIFDYCLLGLLPVLLHFLWKKIVFFLRFEILFCFVVSFGVVEFG